MLSWKFQTETLLLRQFQTCKLTSKGKHRSGGKKRTVLNKVWRNNLQALLRNRIFNGGVFFSRTQLYIGLLCEA